MSKLQPYGRERADSKREIQRLLDYKGKNFVDVAELPVLLRRLYPPQ